MIQYYYYHSIFVLYSLALYMGLVLLRTTGTLLRMFMCIIDVLCL